MTISSQTRKAGPFIGSGSTGPFAFTFKVFQASDILVVTVNTTTQIETTLELTTDYTVSLNSDQNTNPGGSVTLVSALATGNNMVISSQVPYLQETDLTNQGGFYPEVITDALDKLTIEAQQLKEGVDRAAKIPITSEEDPEDLVADLIRLADSADNIDTVANNIADVNTVAGNIDDVTVVSGIADDVVVVSGISADVTSVADNEANINIVAGNIEHVQVVSGIAADVTAVAAIDSDVTAVAADATDIGIVSGNIDSVVTVASNIADVVVVADNDANITVVAGIDSEITTLSGISADITTTATNDANITIVATNIASVNEAAGNIEKIITVANDLNEAVSEIAVVADNIALIDQVGGNMDNIIAVNGNMDAINTVATNIVDVTNFADVYLGPKSSEPSTRNDGSALEAGDLYFNTSSDAMFVYDGAAWVAAYVSAAGFLALSGGTMTGQITFSAGQTIDGYLPLTGGTLTGNLDIDTTGAITLPVGTEAERPGTPATGMLRFNTEATAFEGYDGTEWGAIGGAAPGDAPTLSGPTTGNELQTISLTITNYNASYMYRLTVSGGTVSRVGDTIQWTLPTVTTLTTHYLVAFAIIDGNQSPSTTWSVDVSDVPVTADFSLTLTNFTSTPYSQGWSL